MGKTAFKFDVELTELNIGKAFQQASKKACDWIDCETFMSEPQEFFLVLRRVVRRMRQAELPEASWVYEFVIKI